MGWAVWLAGWLGREQRVVCAGKNSGGAGGWGAGEENPHMLREGRKNNYRQSGNTTALHIKQLENYCPVVMKTHTHYTKEAPKNCGK